VKKIIKKSKQEEGGGSGLLRWFFLLFTVCCIAFVVLDERLFGSGESGMCLCCAFWGLTRLPSSSQSCQESIWEAMRSPYSRSYCSIRRQKAPKCVSLGIVNSVTYSDFWRDGEGSSVVCDTKEAAGMQVLRESECSLLGLCCVFSGLCCVCCCCILGLRGWCSTGSKRDPSLVGGHGVGGLLSIRVWRVIIVSMLLSFASHSFAQIHRSRARN